MPYSASGADVPTYVPQKSKKRWAAIWNDVYAREKTSGKSDKEAETSAFRQANGVAGKDAAKVYEELLQKAAKSEAQAWADAVIEAIQTDFENLPGEVRASLEAAMLSGVGQGVLQVDIDDVASLIASANTTAQDYAVERAAELVGMKYDTEGNLVPNPNAKWAISNTTREKIREIVTEAFGKETPMAEIKNDILAALQEEANGTGIFSEARAELIARTEVTNAQVRGNFWVWQDSGVVKTVRWLTSEDERVCEICSDNDGVVVEIGQPFPDGSLYPGSHPACRCLLVVNSVV